MLSFVFVSWSRYGHETRPARSSPRSSCRPVWRDDTDLVGGRLLSVLWPFRHAVSRSIGWLISRTKLLGDHQDSHFSPPAVSHGRNVVQCNKTILSKPPQTFLVANGLKVEMDMLSISMTSDETQNVDLTVISMPFPFAGHPSPPSTLGDHPKWRYRGKLVCHFCAWKDKRKRRERRRRPFRRPSLEASNDVST